MKIVLRITRAIVALVVSLHVSCLRGQCKLSERSLDKAIRNTDSAKAAVRFAQDAVTYARVNVRESKGLEAQSRKAFGDTVMAADAEAKYWGRSL